MAEVWKVCRVTDDGTLRSAAAYGAEATRYGLDLEYPLGKEVHAPEGTVGIFCFPCLEAAEDFNTFHNDWESAKVLVRCTTTHVPKRLKHVLALWSVRWWRKHAKLLLRRWYADVVGEPRVYSAPRGTCVVPSLTPVERIMA